MQTYPFSFTAQRGSTTIPAQGDLFVYESAENAGGELRVKVKPDNAGEITLRPGQRFRSHTRVTAWNITSYTGTEVVNGSFIIGEGEFDDANTVNTFKLDGTFVNSVNVNNTLANPVPVAFDTKKSLPMEEIVEYTNSIPINNPAVGAFQVFSPAQNTNGMVVVMSETNAGTLLAKTSTPTSKTDGDIIPFQARMQNVGNYGIIHARSIKIDAGKGLWFWADSAGTYSNVMFRKL